MRVPVGENREQNDSGREDINQPRISTKRSQRGVAVVTDDRLGGAEPWRTPASFTAWSGTDRRARRGRRRVLAAMEGVPREAFVPDGSASSPTRTRRCRSRRGRRSRSPTSSPSWSRPGPRRMTGSSRSAPAPVRGRRAVPRRRPRYTRSSDTRGSPTLARAPLATLGYHNIHVRHGDGRLGWAEHAPFDAIIVAAGGPDIPPPLHEHSPSAAAGHPGRHRPAPAAADPRHALTGDRSKRSSWATSASSR